MVRCEHCGQIMVAGVKCLKHKVPACSNCGKHRAKFVECAETND